MIVTSLVSSSVVAEYYYANTGNQVELSPDDLKLWLGEIYDIMGTKGQYIKKVIGHQQDSRYNFNNYTVPLPCDFSSLIPGGILVNGQHVTWTQNSFHYLKSGECCDLSTLNSCVPEIFIDQFGNEFSPSTGSIDSENDCTNTTFDIQDGNITFSRKSGKVCMTYWSMPFDNDGFILVPNTAKYIRALTDYVIWKSDYIAWRQGSIPRDIYEVAEQNKRFSVAAAINEIKLMDGEQMENMKNLLTRLLPKFNEYNNSFRGGNNLEQRSFY